MFLFRHIILSTFFISTFLTTNAQAKDYIEGFPEGCSYANIQQALPGHQLRFGSLVQDYNGDLNLAYGNDFGQPAYAQIAQNAGIIGQEDEADYSDVLIATPRGYFVVAQILDREYEGLAPIVTCLSRIYEGSYYGDNIDYGRAYWVEYERAKRYRFDRLRRDRWLRWKERHELRKQKWRDRRFNKDRFRNWRKDRRDRFDDDDDGRKIRFKRKPFIRRDWQRDGNDSNQRPPRIKKIIRRDSDRDLRKRSPRVFINKKRDDGFNPGRKRMSRRDNDNNRRRGPSKDICVSIGGTKEVCRAGKSNREWRGMLSRARQRGLQVRPL